MLEAALQHAAEGWPVFPCASRDKRPLTSDGFKSATTDADTIRMWWGQEPAANIGIAVPEGLAVIDVDPRNGGDLSSLPPLPATRIADTGGGGVHAWVKVPPGTVLPSTLGPGIDVKNGGRGYVIAPGSVHPSGGLYRWRDLAPVAAAPEWLIAKTRTKGKSAQVAADLDSDGQVQPADAVDRIVDVVAPLYVEGKRHHIAKALGGWLKQRGWTSGDVAAVIRKLPSKDPEARVGAAKAAFSIEQPFGWAELNELLGSNYAEALDKRTPNPQKQGEQIIADVIAQRAPELAALEERTHTKRGILERLRELRDQGPPMPTGIDPIDKSTRGGLRAEKMVVLGGAPGAGKTSLMRQIADYMSRDGVAVGWFAADEEPVGIDIRRVQALGVPRDEAERPSDATLERVRLALVPLPFEIYDTADGWTLETAAVDHARAYPDKPRVFFVDSLQTARTERSAGLEKKGRIDDVVLTLKNLSRHPATKCAVVVTSELARGSYRNEASADATSDLAAFKESGDIEYAGQVLMVLRSLPGESEVVSASQPKNRLGVKRDFLLAFDRETTNFEETFNDPREEARLESAAKVAEEVFRHVSSASWPGITNTDLRSCGLRTQAVQDAFRVLAKDGRIITERIGRRQYWRVPTLAPPTPETPADLTDGIAAAYQVHQS
jgi:hypothetical protein